MIYKSLVHQLEHTVLAMEAKGETHDDIFSTVHMILRGFVRDGELTPEYCELAHRAQEFRSTLQHTASGPQLVTTAGTPLV